MNWIIYRGIIIPTGCTPGNCTQRLEYFLDINVSWYLSEITFPRHIENFCKEDTVPDIMKSFRENLIRGSYQVLGSLEENCPLTEISDFFFFSTFFDVKKNLVYKKNYTSFKVHVSASTTYGNLCLRLGGTSLAQSLAVADTIEDHSTCLMLLPKFSLSRPLRPKTKI